MNPPQVRIATRRDEGELMHLVQVFHKEEGLAPMDEDAVRGVLQGALEGDGVVGVIGEPGRVQSSIHLVMGRLWYTSDRSLESLWTFTLPEYRKSSNTKELIAFAKRQAEKLGFPLLLDIVAKDVRKIGLYERMLGPRAGAVFHYQPNPEKPTEVDGARIRTAVPSDEDEIIAICRELHAENGSFPSDDDLAIPVLRDCLAGNGVIGIAGDGRIEGVIFLRVARLWYSGEPLVEEFFAYVRPEFRGSNNAKNLISFAKRQADRLGISLRMCIVSRIATEQKIKLYQRLLGQPTGAFFLYRPNQEMSKAA